MQVRHVVLEEQRAQFGDGQGISVQFETMSAAWYPELQLQVGGVRFEPIHVVQFGYEVQVAQAR